MGDSNITHGDLMKHLVGIALCSLFLTACAGSSESQRDRMLIGGGLGAATGAVVGAAVGSSGGAALAGAAVGAVGGSIIGAVTAPRECVIRDPDGTPYRVKCP